MFVLFTFFCPGSNGTLERVYLVAFDFWLGKEKINLDGNTYTLASPLTGNST